MIPENHPKCAPGSLVLNARIRLSWYDVLTTTNDMKGRIRMGSKTLQERIDEKVIVDEYGCRVWQGATISNRYGWMTVTVGRNDARNLYAHRVAWALAHGVDPASLPRQFVIRHACALHGAPADNSLCVNPEHLMPGTQADNVVDRQERSVWTSQPKLSHDDVRAIRSSDEPQIVLAQRYGVSQRTISQCQNRRTYKYVSDVAA